jgi:hypothetical protein
MSSRPLDGASGTCNTIGDVFRLTPTGSIEKWFSQSKTWDTFSMCQRKDGRWITTSHAKTYFMDRVLWELTHGPMEKNEYLVHADGDPSNWQLDNLRKVAKRDVRTVPLGRPKAFPFRKDEKGRLWSWSPRKDKWVLANAPIGQPRPFVTYEDYDTGRRKAMWVEDIEKPLGTSGLLNGGDRC